MIDYEKTNRGDILKLVGAGAPGYAKLGDLVRVLERTKLGVLVENKHGEKVEFVYNCGAARLEPTEWRNDFPDQQMPSGTINVEPPSTLAPVDARDGTYTSGD